MSTSAKLQGLSFSRPHRAWNRARAGRILLKTLSYLVLVVGAMLVCAPWGWMVLTSLKTPTGILRIPLTIFPTKWMWKNYIEVFAWAARPMYKTVWNTLQIALFCEIGVLLSNTVVAFGFSRLRWEWRDAFFIAVLAPMMLPRTVTMIPLFAIFTAKLHWGNTYLPLIVPSFFGYASSIFLMRQYMMTIPAELDDAAFIDGCSTMQLFLRIILPMSTPVLAVVAIFTFNGVWNSFLVPLLYITKPDLYTVALYVASFATVSLPGEMPRHDLLMAASVLSSLPLALVFFVFQRQFIQGIVITGVKG